MPVKGRLSSRKTARITISPNNPLFFPDNPKVAPFFCLEIIGNPNLELENCEFQSLRFVLESMRKTYGRDLESHQDVSKCDQNPCKKIALGMFIFTFIEMTRGKD